MLQVLLAELLRHRWATRHLDEIHESGSKKGPTAGIPVASLSDCDFPWSCSPEFDSTRRCVPVTSSGIAYDCSAPRGGVPALLLHAGVADRRMWNPQWDALAETWDVVRLDLRGFGASATPPTGPLSHVEDVIATMDDAGLERVHLVGASVGSGVAVEVALTVPDRVASLFLCPPGGGLLRTRTDDLVTFCEEENAALDVGDLDAAVEANVRAWVVGPGRTEADVDPSVVAAVRQMQRRAFEIDEVLGEVERVEMTPVALERLDHIEAPTLILLGGYDLETIKDAAAHLCTGIAQVQRIDWPDAAHLPSLEHPDRFTDLLLGWLGAHTDPDRLSARGAGKDPVRRSPAHN